MMTKKVLSAVVLALVLVLLSNFLVAAEGPGQDGPVLDEMGDIGVQDELLLDDLIVHGSVCTGIDCVSDQDFDYDTLVLKENNLRIYFNDTSSSSFPFNDWRIAINDASYGGQSYFRIEDVTGAVTPFTILAGGNVGIGTETPTEKLHVAGNVRIDGSIAESSDVNAKENFVPVEEGEVLEALAGIPISTWNYKADDPAVRHMGPMAQDFYAAFGLGEDDRHIAPLDTNGVAIAAIQELNQRVQEQDAQIAALQQQNAALEVRLAALEASMSDVSQK